MRRQGRITASMEETRKYLLFLVHQLFTMYNNNKTACGKEVDSGFRDSLMTYLLATTENAIKGFFNEIKAYVHQVYGLVITVQKRKLRLYFYIEPVKNPAL